MTTSSGSAPIQVPKALLRRPEFIAACGNRDFGAAFHLIKKYGGISQVKLAAALDMTPSRVGEVIKGRRQIASIDVIERVSDRLHIPGHYLGLSPRHWEANETAKPEPGLEEVAAILGYDELDVTVDNAVRIAHTWLTVEPPQRAELKAGSRLGANIAQRIEARVRHLRRMDDFIGGRDSFPIVVGEVDATAALIREGSYTDATRSALLAALAELCQVAGWVLDDAGKHDTAARYYVAGAQAAEAGGHPGPAANLLSTLSYSRANTGHTHDAVLLARSAAISAGSHAAPAGRAILWDRAAWAHAMNHDAELCLQALDEADRAWSRADGHETPEWAYWLDRSELDVMAGRCFTELGRPKDAEPLLVQTVQDYDATREREAALYRSWLAEAYAKAGDVDRAAAQTMKVLDAVDGVNSARLDDRVVVLRQALHRYADAPGVRDVEERAQAIMRIA
jgi:transcriptional regulator with XRE-family HTH domain